MGLEPRLEIDRFCYNRYNNALAFTLTLSRMRGGSNAGSWGPIIFLPRVELSEDETVALVLSDLCGVEGSVPEPEWVQAMKAPGQQDVDEEISVLTQEVGKRLEALREKQEQRDKLRGVLRLIYDKGPTLEAEVRHVLSRLGAEVEAPTDPGKEDGWIKVNVEGEVFEGVIEVTGTRTDQFGEAKLRQLLDWINRGVELRQKKFKGVFIGVNAIDRPPVDRPSGFSSSWLKSAELHGIAAVRGEDLYDLLTVAYDDPASDELLRRFWRLVFSTDGLVDVKQILMSS
jgi:hypothetical protein